MVRASTTLALLGATALAILMTAPASGEKVATIATHRNLRGDAAVESQGLLTFIKLLAPNLSPEQEAEIDHDIHVQQLLIAQSDWDKEAEKIRMALEDRTAIANRVDEDRRSDAVAAAQNLFTSEMDRLGKRPE